MGADGQKEQSVSNTDVWVQLHKHLEVWSHIALVVHADTHTHTHTANDGFDIRKFQVKATCVGKLLNHRFLILSI